MRKKKNLFSPLYRWASANRQGENFTTDAFAALLREMIGRELQLVGRDSGLASRFLGWLCFDCEKCGFFGPKTEVDTQWVDEHGRPDMRISDADESALALVEVKTFTNLRENQLQDYLKILDKEAAAKKSLVLLTAFDASVGDHEKPLIRWRRWHEVDKWLSDNRPNEPVLRFLIKEFCSFLRETGMSFDHVEWEYVRGVKSLVDITNMISQACYEKKVTSTCKTPGMGWSDGEPWVGVYSDRNQFSVGVRWHSPRFVRFQFEYASADPEKLKDERGWQQGADGRWETPLDLESEDVHFFALITQHQKDRLADFIKNAYDAAQRCTAANQPPPPPQMPPAAPS